MSRSDPDEEIVLLVDDSPESLGFLTHALEQAGVTVLVARSGEAALRIGAQMTPDVVLMDAVMPGLDGFQACRALKAMPGLSHVPVIFMTALSETEHIVNALESGGVDYLAKPIDVEELRARMRVHLANARRTRSTHIALDAAGRYLVAFAQTGAVAWATPQARTLLERIGQGTRGEDAVAPLFVDWQARAERRVGTGFEVRKVTPALDFSFLGVVGRGEFLFRLAAARARSDTGVLQEAFGLTQRESEVLVWISRGKSNRDTGEILALSPRTVNKHLEQIFVKLGVENRVAAAVRALDAMRAAMDVE